MASVASPLPHNQVYDLLDGSNSVSVFLGSAQIELPLDLHDEASQIIINDLKVMNKVCLLCHLTSIYEADDINKKLNDFFADLNSREVTFHFLPHTPTF
jgi:hypothetical protein